MLMLPLTVGGVRSLFALLLLEQLLPTRFCNPERSGRVSGPEAWS